MSQSPSPLETLWYTRCPVPTGLGIAIQNGWLEQSFEGQGVRVACLRESEDLQIREAHYDQNLRHSVRHGGSIPAIWSRAVGRATTLIGLSWADEIQLVLTRADTGIREPKDLKGRRVGLSKRPDLTTIDVGRAQSLRSLENALRLAGLEVGDVEIVDYVIGGGYSEQRAEKVGRTLLFSGPDGVRGRNAELIGLLRGEVDAIAIKGAQAAQWAQDFGLVTVIDTGTHPEPLIRSNNGTPRTLTVETSLAESHFDATVNIVRQVLRAEDWAARHPDETRRYLALEVNVAESWVHRAYEQAGQQLRTDLSETSIASLQDFTDFLARWNFIPQSIDVRAWIDTRPLDVALGRVAAAA